MTSASLNALEASRPPAVVRAAKDWRFYESTIAKMHESTGALLKEYKESGAWREHYNSWAAACEPLNISKRHADRLIEIEMGQSCPTPSKKDKEETLNKLSKLPDPLSTNPETDGLYEKPAVHSADEKKRGEVNPRSNGKPISCHHVWHELEEGLGKMLNRADEANRISPNRGKHLELLSVIKRGMEITRQWQNLK